MNNKLTDLIVGIYRFLDPEPYVRVYLTPYVLQLDSNHNPILIKEVEKKI